MGPGRGNRGSEVASRYPLLGRAAWSFLAQTASSGSNFALTVLVLAVSTASEFAVFAVGLTTYLFTVQLMRSTVGIPVTLLYTGGSSSADHEDQRAAIGVGVALGLVTGSVVLAGSAVAAEGHAQLVVLGASLPFLLWQDMVRYVCFARGRPSAAAAADSLWLVLQLLGSTAAFTAGRASAATLVGAWAAGGVVSACVVGIRLGLAPRMPAAGRWLRRHRALCWRLLAEFMVSAGSHYAVYYGLAIVAGSDQLGRLKAAQTLLGPVVVLLLSGGVLGVPESVRAAHEPPLLRRIAVRLSAVLAGGSLLWGIITYLALPTVGPAVFPNTWATARPLLPVLTAFAVAFGASIGATGALRALGASPWLLRLRTVSGALLVMLGVVASARFGASGALSALAVVEGAVAALAWRHLLRLTAHPGTTLSSDEGKRTEAGSPFAAGLGVDPSALDRGDSLRLSKGASAKPVGPIRRGGRQAGRREARFAG